MSQVFSYPDFFSVVLVMVLAGIVGGIVNHFYVPLSDSKATLAGEDPPPTQAKKKTSTQKSLAQSIVVGIGASLLIPVFFFLTQSRLLDTLINPVMLTDSVTTGAAQSLPPVPINKSAGKVDTAKVNKPTALTVTNGKPNGSSPSGYVTLPEKVKAYLVFFSFCLIAAISGFRFISSISERAFLDLSKRVDENTKKVDENTKQTTDAKAKATVATTQAAEATKQATEAKSLAAKADQTTTTTSTTTETQGDLLREVVRKTNNVQPANVIQNGVTEPVVERESTPGIDRNALIERVLAQKGTHDDDTQKGRWGGKPESENYWLKAEVEPIDKQGCYCAVTIWAEAKDPQAHPLKDSVVFLLDSTFAEPKQTVPVGADGKAALKRLIAWGVFTTGAVTSDGETLELDLADLPNLPGCFRNAIMPPSLKVAQ